jgi:hypothetical protein
LVFVFFLLLPSCFMPRVSLLPFHYHGRREKSAEGMGQREREREGREREERRERESTEVSILELNTSEVDMRHKFSQRKEEEQVKWHHSNQSPQEEN